MTNGRTEESFRAGQRALQLDPVDLANNSHQGWHYLFMRQYDRAIEPLQKTIQALSKEEKYVPPYPIAVIHAGLGERDLAIEWLEKAYEERDSWMNYLHLDPRLDSLRADPRFVSLVGRMRFTR